MKIYIVNVNEERKSKNVPQGTVKKVFSKKLHGRLPREYFAPCYSFINKIFPCLSRQKKYCTPCITDRVRNWGSRDVQEYILEFCTTTHQLFRRKIHSLQLQLIRNKPILNTKPQVKYWKILRNTRYRNWICRVIFRRNRIPMKPYLHCVIISRKKVLSNMSTMIWLK